MCDADESKIRFFSAAGRTELGGNHTDHNHGRVLCASIQLDAIAAVLPNAEKSDKSVVLHSIGFPEVDINLTNLEPVEAEKGKTEALVRGIAAEFEKEGVKTGGFTAVTSSTVLSGSGLSSSAAIEVLIGTIFNNLFAEGKFSTQKIAQIGQKAENIYFGKPCGLMDQLACATGGAISIDFRDNIEPKVEKIDFQPEKAGFALAIVDTKTAHADLTAEYAAIPDEMKAAAARFGKNYLRELRIDDVLKDALDIRAELGDRALLRALHFFREDERVVKMTGVLKRLSANEKDSKILKEFLNLVKESGRSSFEFLQNGFDTKNVKSQGITVALALSDTFFSILSSKGVSRIHGGGFAGTIQSYIELEHIEEYKSFMDAYFGCGACTVLNIRSVGATEVGN
jgi:galactokinase